MRVVGCRARRRRRAHAATSTNSPRARFGVGREPARRVAARASSRRSRTAWSARGRSSPSARGRPSARAPARASMRCGASNSTWAASPAPTRFERGARARRPSPAGSRRRRSRPRARVAGRRSARPARCSAPGIGTTRWPAARDGGDQRRAGVADRRRAGVADVGHALAARRAARAPRSAASRSLCSCTASSGLSRPKWRSRAALCARVLAGDGVDRSPARAGRAGSGRPGCRSAWRRRTARRGILLGAGGHRGGLHELRSHPPLAGDLAVHGFR